MSVAAPDVGTDPAYLWVPEHVSTWGSEVADLAASAGLHLDREQRLALDAMYAERSDGKWAAFEFALICCRQNMKTVTFQAAALADLFLFNNRLIVWTAHLFPTTVEAFRDISTLIDGAPHLSREVKAIHAANGDEGIELHNGHRLNFRARTRTGGRGLSGDVVFLDEGFALTGTETGSLLPTTMARPNPQVRYGSSAGMAHSTVLRTIRDRGRPGGDPRLGYMEFCAPREPCATEDCFHTYGVVAGCALDDRSLWKPGNPAMGRRITEEAIADMRRSLLPNEFMRECLGWWDEPAEILAAVPPDKWLAGADPTSKITGAPLLAVSMTPDRALVTLIAAGRRQDGKMHVEVVEHGRAGPWFVPRVAQVARRHSAPVYLHPGHAVGALVPKFEDANIRLEPITAREYVQSNGTFYDLVDAGELRYPAPQPELDDAIDRATRKPTPDAWKWSGEQIGPLVAASIAVHAVTCNPDYDVLASVY